MRLSIPAFLLILASAILSWPPQILGQDTATPTPSLQGPSDGRAELFGAMSRNPKFKEWVRDQSRKETKEIFQDFIKQCRLSSQQSELFFNLIFDDDERDFEDASASLFGEKNSAESDANTGQTLAAQHAETERQLHMLLGEANYARYQEYLKTISERVALSQIRQQFRSNNVLLSDEEAKVLLQILFEERARTRPMAFDPRAPGSNREKTAVVLKGDNAEEYYETQSDLNRRILGRAGAVLSPEQYEALDKFQQRHLEAQKIGIELERGRLRQPAGGTGAAAPTPSP